MAPANSYAKTTLSFPIFAAEFDPYSRGYLVVGGGGGEGRSGVPNQIVSIAVLCQSLHPNHFLNGRAGCS
jgi:prolactin regulatory element-binding protein